MKILDGQVGEVFRRVQLPEDWQSQLVELLERDDDREIIEVRRSRLTEERRRLKLMKVRGEFDDDPDLYNQEQARIRRELADLPTPADMETIDDAANLLEELAKIWDDAELVDNAIPCPMAGCALPAEQGP